MKGRILDINGLPYFMQADPDLADLTDDGDRTEWRGYVVTLKVEPDDGWSFDDWSDCYGAIAHVDDCRDRNTGQTRRPAGFDGAARIIRCARDNYWWQPPADIKSNRDLITSTERALRDLLEYGAYAIGLEVTRGTDAYNRPVVVAQSWVGGFEPFLDAATVAEVVADLWYSCAEELGVVG